MPHQVLAGQGHKPVQICSLSAPGRSTHKPAQGPNPLLQIPRPDTKITQPTSISSSWVGWRCFMASWLRYTTPCTSVGCISGPVPTGSLGSHSLTWSSMPEVASTGKWGCGATLLVTSASPCSTVTICRQYVLLLQPDDVVAPQGFNAVHVSCPAQGALSEGEAWLATDGTAPCTVACIRRLTGPGHPSCPSTDLANAPSMVCRMPFVTACSASFRRIGQRQAHDDW